ncbi:MAG: hypothetical protein IJ730_03185, partial [Alphaproteobacteria bacterium]|nr:hypothetical protein [Alphaproteobacteria bacterium]
LKDWNSVVKSSYCAKQYDLYLTDNFSRMLRTINSLNLVCAFHHQRQFDKEKAELNELFKEIEILCRNFLKEEEYLSMKERNLFIFSNNNENNLKNIGRIFINIYGNQDNFILTYVHQLVKL